MKEMFLVVIIKHSTFSTGSHVSTLTSPKEAIKVASLHEAYECAASCHWDYGEEAYIYCWDGEKTTPLTKEQDDKIHKLYEEKWYADC